jgi:hypothetical protein
LTTISEVRRRRLNNIADDLRTRFMAGVMFA